MSGFDPYGFGSWVYTTGPGYVWSSGYSWGWTPFRCGSWSYWQGFGWGWVPGRGCGYAGWGFGGGGWGGGGGGWGTGGGRRVNRINLSTVPPGYKRPLPPVAGGPVRVHPIVPVRTGPGPADRGVHAFEAGRIAGTTVMPLRTLGAGYTARGGSAVGASLRRDFPVDRVTRQPVMGSVTVPPVRPVTAAQGSMVVAGPGRSGTGRNGTGQAGVAGETGKVRDAEAVRPVYPAGRLAGGSGSGLQPTRPRYGAGGSDPRAGSAGSGSSESSPSTLRSAPADASVPSPPPPGESVRVHPGETVGDRGNRVGQPGSVNRTPPPAVSVRPAPMPSAPPPAMRSVPSAPPPAPAPVRSAPAPAAAAPASAPKK